MRTIQRTTRTKWGRPDVVEYLQPGPVTPWGASFGPLESARWLEADHHSQKPHPSTSYIIREMSNHASRRGEPHGFDLVHHNERFTVVIRVPREDGEGVEWVRDTSDEFLTPREATRRLNITRPDQARVGDARIVQIKKGGQL